MKTIGKNSYGFNLSRLAYGCWRVAGSNPRELTAENEKAGIQAIITAYEAGYTVFDNADIYGGGAAEILLGKALKEVSGMRKNVVIVTKCGVRRAGDPKPEFPYRYDFSKEYIISSCENSLKRLGIDSIDIYLLHRPDHLCDPAEVAEAFEKLHSQGKVKAFGVSNFSPSQITMLQKYCPFKIITNQIEISLLETSAFEDGRLDHCITEKIIPMAWSPLGGGLIFQETKYSITKASPDKVERVRQALLKISSKYGTSSSVIALAWLLKHPSQIMPIVGSINPERIREAAKADDIELTREDWYYLYEASRGSRLP